MTELDRATLLDHLLEYVKNELGAGVPAELLTADSQLLELGVLDSVRTARLLAHIRSEYGVRIPPLYMTGEHFRTLGTIADLVLLLDSQTAAL